MVPKLKVGDEVYLNEDAIFSMNLNTREEMLAALNPIKIVAINGFMGPQIGHNVEVDGPLSKFFWAECNFTHISDGSVKELK